MSHIYLYFNDIGFTAFSPIWQKLGKIKWVKAECLEVNGSTRQSWKKCVGVYGGGVGVGGCQISMEREWEGMEVRGAACWYNVWCWCWLCVRMWVCMMWLRKKSTSQSSGRPVFKKVAAEREREEGSWSREAEVNTIQIFLSCVTDQMFFINFIFILNVLFH